MIKSAWQTFNWGPPRCGVPSSSRMLTGTNLDEVFMVTGSPSSYAQTSTNECTTVLVLIRICQDRQQGKDSSSRTENLNHFVLMHWNILQRLAPPVAMKYILLSCHPHGMVWPVVLHVKARVLGCTGTNGVGRRLGLAGAVSLSDLRPGGLWLRDEVEIGTSLHCEATLTRAFPFLGAKLQG